MNRRRQRPTCIREPSGLNPFPLAQRLWTVYFPLGATDQSAEAWLAARGLHCCPFGGPTWGYRDHRIVIEAWELIYIPDFQI